MGPPWSPSSPAVAPNCQGVRDHSHPVRGHVRQASSPVARSRARDRARLRALALLVALMLGSALTVWLIVRSEDNSKPAAAPCAEGSTSPSAINMRVLNATGREGLAASVATELRKRGYNVTGVGNDSRNVPGAAEVRHGSRELRRPAQSPGWSKEPPLARTPERATMWISSSARSSRRWRPSNLAQPLMAVPRRRSQRDRRDRREQRLIVIALACPLQQQSGRTSIEHQGRDLVAEVGPGKSLP